MALRGADGDALVQRMQELELEAVQEEQGEVKTLTEAEERALPSRVSATMEQHGDVGLERWARQMQLDKEEFEQKVEQMVEVEEEAGGGGARTLQGSDGGKTRASERLRSAAAGAAGEGV